MVDKSWLGLSNPPSPKSPYQPQAGLIGKYKPRGSGREGGGPGWGGGCMVGSFITHE